MSVTLRQVIEALIEREELDWAEACAWVLPFEPMIDHGFSFDDVLDMSIDEIEAWRQLKPRPPKYEGWDTFYWGEAA